MAIRLKIDISGISFPFTTEYSIDSGATWTAKAVDEEYIIPYDDITDPEKKVMIRSDSVDATVLTRDNLNLDSISYSNITIKNGKLIETMEELFSGAFFGDVKISGVPALKNIRRIAHSSLFRDFHIEPLPKCEDAYQAFAYSMGRDIGNIAMGDDTGSTIGVNCNGLARSSVFDSVGCVTIKNAIDASNVTTSSRINVMGHIDVEYAGPTTPALASYIANGRLWKGAAIARQAGIYCYTDFDVCPSGRYVGHISTSADTGPESSSFTSALARKTNYLNGLRETYYPSVDILSMSTFSDTVVDAFDYALYQNNSPLKFGGISYSALGLKSALLACDHATQYTSQALNSDPLLVFAQFRSLANLNYSTSVAYSMLGVKLQEYEFAGKTFYSNPKWFPRHEVLYSGKVNDNSTASAIGFMAFGRRYARIESIGSDIVITKNIRIQPLDECTMDGEIFTIPNSTYAIGNSQGSYAYNNANDDGCVFVSSDGVTTQAIAGVTLNERTILSADEKWIYVLSGESIDTAGTAGQNIVQTLKKYSTADGSIVEDITINNPTDTYARLFYKAFDGYDLKIIFDKYTDDGVTYFKEGTFVTSIDEDGNIDPEAIEIPLDSPVDVITHHYGETFEFTGVHLASGSLTRMIGK